MSRAFIEGRKTIDAAPEYSFGWQTSLTAGQAFELMNEVDTMEGIMARRATLAIVRKQGVDEYEWKAGESEVGDEQAVSEEDLKLPEANLVRLIQRNQQSVGMMQVVTMGILGRECG